MSAKLSFFSIKTQFENIGDALINRELMLLAAANSDVVADLSRCPPFFVKTLGVSDHARITVVMSTLQLFMQLLQARLRGDVAYYFLSPGGYVGELSWLACLKRLPNTLLLVLCWLVGVRICHVGVSYERIGPRHAAFLRLRSGVIYRHFVRDEISREYVRSLGLRVDGVIPDMAFNLFDKPVDASQTGSKVCFSFRTDQSARQMELVRNYIAWCVAQYPAETEYVMAAQVERDIPGMQQLQGWLQEKLGRPVGFYACHDDIPACQAFYATCRVVISNRLHVLLLGASRTGRLVAAISGQDNRKIEGLFALMGMADNIFAMDTPLDGAAATRFAAARERVFDGSALNATLRQGFAGLYD